MAVAIPVGGDARQNLASANAARWIFFGAGLLLFGASAAVTIIRSMPVMEGMPMPGGWTMSMAWMRMPGQTWPGALTAFLGMWLVMMAAMMLPSLLPMLWRYHQTVLLADRAHPGRSAVLAGLVYFLVWTLLGLAVYPLGAGLAAIQMRLPVLSRAVPLAASIVVLLAGAWQFTAWKARHLACCRASPDHDRPLPGGAAASLRHGLRLGLHCIRCCAGPTAALFAIGWMDLRAMVAVTAAVTVERLAAGKIGRHAVGAVAIATGAVLLVRAVASVCGPGG